MAAIQRVVQESTAVLALAAPYARQLWASVWPRATHTLRRLLAAGQTVSRAGYATWRSWPARRRAKASLAVAGALLVVVWLRGCSSEERRVPETPATPAGTTSAARSSGVDPEQRVLQFQVPEQSPTVLGDTRSTDEQRPGPPPSAAKPSGRSSEPTRKERVTVLRPVQPITEDAAESWDRLLVEQDMLQKDVEAFVRQLTQKLPDDDAARVAMLRRLCSTGALLQELARWRREPGKEYLLDDASRAELQRLTHRWQAWEQAVVSEAARETLTPDP